MTTRGGRLVLVMSLVGVLSCSEIRGKGMTQSSNGCRNTPTIQECQSTAANLITDACLRKCVIEQCASGVIVCGDDTMASCSKRARKNPSKPPAGYVIDHEQTCQMPHNQVHWCQRDQSPKCQDLTMVHEVAHACGWHHKQGKGVPGNEGEIEGCNLQGR
jgi:hypothetical protein